MKVESFQIMWIEIRCESSFGAFVEKWNKFYDFWLKMGIDFIKKRCLMCAKEGLTNHPKLLGFLNLCLSFGFLYLVHILKLDAYKIIHSYLTYKKYPLLHFAKFLGHLRYNLSAERVWGFAEGSSPMWTKCFLQKKIFPWTRVFNKPVFLQQIG